MGSPNVWQTIDVIADVRTTYIVRVGTGMTSLPMFNQTFCYPSFRVEKRLHAVYLIPATPFEGLVRFYLLTVIYDVTVTIKIYLVT